MKNRKLHMDRAQKTKNSFIFRLMIVACIIFGLYRVLIYFFGTPPPVDEAEIGDFADQRIDRFYQQGDGEPLPGTQLPPPPEETVR